MIGIRQRTGHMIVVMHPTNLDVWLVTMHLDFFVLESTSHKSDIRSCECWRNC